MGYLNKVVKKASENQAITGGKPAKIMTGGKSADVWSELGDGDYKGAMRKGATPTNPLKKRGGGSGGSKGGSPGSMDPTTGEMIPGELPAVTKDAKYSPESYKTQGSVYEAKAYSNPNAAGMSTALGRRFDLLRSKAEGEANTQADTVQGNLARAAAAKGRLGSGSLQKQVLGAQKQLNAQKMGSIDNIESQRELALEEQNQKEADKAFAFNQEEQGRVFQSGEAYNQRNFAGSEAVKQRNFDQQNIVRDQNFKNKLNDQANAQFREQMNMSIEQFKMDKDVTEFNKKMAKKNSGGGHRDAVQRFGDWWGTVT